MWHCLFELYFRKTRVSQITAFKRIISELRFSHDCFFELTIFKIAISEITFSRLIFKNFRSQKTDIERSWAKLISFVKAWLTISKFLLLSNVAIISFGLPALEITFL